MNKDLKPIPKFKNEVEEREFWLSHDFTDYVDFDNAENRIVEEFVNLKPSTKKMTIRVPESMINELKVIANKKDVPYQSLVKVMLSEKIKEELYRKAL